MRVMCISDKDLTGCAVDNVSKWLCVGQIYEVVRDATGYTDSPSSKTFPCYVLKEYEFTGFVFYKGNFAPLSLIDETEHSLTSLSVHG